MVNEMIRLAGIKFDKVVKHSKRLGGGAADGASMYTFGEDSHRTAWRRWSGTSEMRAQGCAISLQKALHEYECTMQEPPQESIVSTRKSYVP